MKHVKLKHGIARVSKDIKPETLNALDEMMKAAGKQMTQEVKTRPILFSTAMVKAILAGDKTMTRRVMKPQIPHIDGIKISRDGDQWFAMGSFYRCPFGKPGNRLWVREAHYRYGYWSKDGLTKQGRQRWRFIAVHESRIPEQFEKVYYEATSRPPVILTKRSAKRGWYKRPSIFLPYALARIVNEITDVKVERLQQISGQDCAAEGMMLRRWLQEDRGEGQPFFDKGIKADGLELQLTFRNGWDKINGKRKGCAWADNPWCWVLSFRRIQPK